MAISAETPDWSRERPGRFWDPGRKLLKAIRDYQRLARGGALGALRRKLIVLRHRFWSVVTGADIPLNAKIGGGLMIPHPSGIVVHPGAVIGVNCLLMQQATLGVREGVSGSPVLGGHVDVGAGAKILGPVRIGDHARIGANAVVLADVPARAVAVGVPARVIPAS
jgi:serine O-acetyltransferase